MLTPAMGCRSLFTVFDALSCPLGALITVVGDRSSTPRKRTWICRPGMAANLDSPDSPLLTGEMR